MSEEAIQQIYFEAVLSQHLERYRPLIERTIGEFLPQGSKTNSDNFKTGNRALPVLTLFGAELAGGKAENVLHAAVAAEFINLGSEILQDIEKREVLTAIGLLNSAYGLVFVNHGEQPDRAIKAHAEISEFMESFIERSAEGKEGNTQALISLSFRLGAVLAGADFVRLNEVTRFAESVGEAWELSGKPLFIDENVEESLRVVDDGVTRFNISRLCNEARNVLFNNFAPSSARGILLQLVDLIEGKNSDQERL